MTIMVTSPVVFSVHTAQMRTKMQINTMLKQASTIPKFQTHLHTGEVMRLTHELAILSLEHNISVLAI